MELLNFLVVMILLGGSIKAYGAISQHSWSEISKINRQGPYIGIVVPNAYEMNPLLQSPSFVVNNKFPYLDFAGRRFRIGELEKKKVIVVMTGLGMMNGGISTHMLLALFHIEGVVHYGIAGNANPQLHIGDVTIPQYWAHTGLWLWQRFGDAEANGNYNRGIAYLKFSDYNNHSSKHVENLLNTVWYEADEIFPVYENPEVMQHAFWVPVDKTYFKIARKLKDVELGSCVNTTCLPRKPMVVRVKRGASANVFIDNKAYREFLNSKFDVSPIDMESAAVALVCFQQKTPFIVIRSLSDLAGGGSALSNEAHVFKSLASQNAFDVLIKFVSLLRS